MRVLMLHNRYLLPGGEDISYETDVAMLRRAGHDVETMEESNARIGELGALRTGLRAMWSRETFGRVRERLQQQEFDVVHVQNFFPLLSPAAYYAARAAGVAVVQTLRNYRLVCAGRDLFRQGQVCELCVGKALPWPGVLHACYRQSRGATSLVAAMVTVHRLVGTWHNCVDRYIALTRFGREKFAQGGLPAAKLVVRPNTVYPDPGAGPGQGGFAVFVGRLEEQKGVRTLLAAWRHLARPMPLMIIGDGPLRPLVLEQAGPGSTITWEGTLPARDVLDRIGRAEFAVVCSQSYEGQPRVIIEALARGTPVIAPRLGAMAEMIDHGVTGRLSRPGDAGSLAEEVGALMAHLDKLPRMRVAARRAFERHFEPCASVDTLARIYADAIEARPLRREGGKAGQRSRIVTPSK